VQQSVTSRGPVTFGQLSLWRSIEKLPPEACNLPQTWALPAGTTTGPVERALETLEDRHESLRTRYEEDGDGLIQVVLAPAPAALGAIEADPGDVAQDLAARTFDLAADRPWRARLVTSQGAPSHLAICFHHIAVDAWAINQLHEEFLALLAGRPLAADAPNCRDLAAEQWSEARKSRRRSALKHWDQLFREAPAIERDPAPEAVTSRWARQGSTAAAEAVHRIADRLAVSVPSVVLSAFCVALSRHTGQAKLLVAVYANNRSDPRWEHLVAAQNQIVPLLVTVDPDEEFDAFVTRVHWESLRSYKHGSYNVDDVFDLGKAYGYTGTVNGSFEGSVSGFFRYFFNYLGEYQKGQTSAEEEIETGTTGRNIGVPLYLQVQDGEALTFTLRENSSSSGFDRVAGLLLALQDIILAAAEKE
jgi:condensation domain-containing protein